MTRRQVLLVFATLTVTAVAAQNNDHRLTVKELFELVETGNKQLQTQKQGEVVASQGITVAKSQRLPEINSSISASYIGNVVMTDREFDNVHGFSSPHFGNSLAVEAQQVVYAGGAVSAGIRMAELQHEQSQAATSLTRQQQRFLALGFYLDLLKLDNRMKVFDENIALTQVLIDNIGEKFSQGMALRNDITRYELQMETLKLGKEKLANQRSILNYQLCQTLGLDESTQIMPDEHVASEAYANNSMADWQAEATTHSPLLQQSSIGIEMAKNNEKLTRSEMLPKVALVAADNFDGPITFELPPVNKNLNVWYAGIGVKYNISSLFKSNKKLQQARLATQQQELSHKANAEHVSQQMQQAWTYYQQAYVELETQKKKVQLAAQNYDVMNERYLNQLALVTDMVDASNLKLNAEMDEVDARVGIAFAYYKMKLISGTL